MTMPNIMTMSKIMTMKNANGCQAKIMGIGERKSIKINLAMIVVLVIRVINTGPQIKQDLMTIDEKYLPHPPGEEEKWISAFILTQPCDIFLDERPVAIYFSILTKIILPPYFTIADPILKFAADINIHPSQGNLLN